MSVSSALDGQQNGDSIGDADRRDFPRIKSLLQGIVYYNDRSAAADCLIRDISDTGARLELSETVVIPYLIDLYIPKREETLRASVQWRHGDLVGIAFTTSQPATEPVAGDSKMPAKQTQIAVLTERVRQLEDEVASLKQSVKNLLTADNSRLPV